MNLHAVSPESLNRRKVIEGLIKRFFLLLVVQAALLWMGYKILIIWWTLQFASRWLMIATISSAGLGVVIWQNLGENYTVGIRKLMGGFGAGNVLTIIRGFLICTLAGFLFSPNPQGWMAWIPGLLYSLAALADLFDGYLARRDNQVTRFGEILDLRLDGLGVLIACILLVQYRQVPSWYLLVGLARYLFVLGIWIRRQLGKQVYKLTTNLTRRPFAGAQMGFMAVVLFPVFSPPGTSLVAALFALPFLVGFMLDWLVVSGSRFRLTSVSIFGKARNDDREYKLPVSSSKGISKWIPVVVRFMVVLLLVAWLVKNFAFLISQPVHLFGELDVALNLPDSWLGLAFLFLVVGLVLITLGAAGRLAALLVLFGVGLFQYSSNIGSIEIAMLISATVLLYMGTGPFSLWVPEKKIIAKRIGEV